MNRRALLVGINRYRQPGNDLKGCVNDVDQVGRLLSKRYGFAEGGITRLVDRQATKGAILSALDRLVAGASPGDSLVFHFSGHGSQVPDRHGDEAGDRLDEVLCPHDMDWADPLTDDVLAGALLPLPPGVRLTLVLDCCHSGTALRDREAAGAGRFLPPPPDGAGRWGVQGGPASRRPGKRVGGGAALGGAVLLAACRDDQTSADARIDGAYHGAHTYYLCRALERAGGRLTCREAAADLSRSLREARFSQEPQLEGPAELLARQFLGIEPAGGNLGNHAA